MSQRFFIWPLLVTTKSTQKASIVTPDSILAVKEKGLFSSTEFHHLRMKFSVFRVLMLSVDILCQFGEKKSSFKDHPPPDKKKGKHTLKTFFEFLFEQ